MAALLTDPLPTVRPGFIGPPSMNLAHGRIEGTEAAPVVVLGDHHWPLPGVVLDRSPHLRTMAGRSVIVGLLPASLALLAADDGPRTPRISIAAVHVDSLGHEKNVVFRPPFATAPRGADDRLQAMWTARVDPDAAVFAGQAVTLRLDLAEAYFFDAETGLALL